MDSFLREQGSLGRSSARTGNAITQGDQEVIGTNTVKAVPDDTHAITPHLRNSPSVWYRRIGLGLSTLAAFFFLLDASGKLLRVEPVLKGTLELGWPLSAVVPMGLLLVI